MTLFRNIQQTTSKGNEMLRKLKEFLRNFWEDLIYPINLGKFLEEETRHWKLEKIARDCAILEEKIKAAKRKKKKSSHIEREFVLKKSELLRCGND
jgi:hypothetical protein